MGRGCEALARKGRVRGKMVMGRPVKRVVRKKTVKAEPEPSAGKAAS